MAGTARIGGAMRRGVALVAILFVMAAMSGGPAAGAGSNVRLTNDDAAYVSVYTMATGTPYTDGVLTECSQARGRQNEPAAEIDPMNTNVVVGSSNDYCGVYQPPNSATPSPTGPVWLGYYRSENGGAS